MAAAAATAVMVEGCHFMKQVDKRERVRERGREREEERGGGRLTDRYKNGRQRDRREPEVVCLYLSFIVCRF